MTSVNWEWLPNTACYKIIPGGKCHSPGTGKWAGQGLPETLAALDKVAPGVFLQSLPYLQGRKISN